jgi:polysaccharide biosynthesis transport protein
LLNAATAPLDASKPRVIFNTLISVFLGLLLGTGLALVLELVNRRVRSARDLIETLELPVLGTIAAAPSVFWLSTSGRRV